MTGYSTRNVLNEKPTRPVTWTTVNAGEAAFPGVPTPLSWTWSWWPTEYGVRGAFASIGCFDGAFATPPDALADRILTIHHGHVAINLDLFRAVADAIPTSSGDEIERSFFGSVRPGVASRPRRARYPIVAVRMPAAAVRSRAVMRGSEQPTDRWWRAAVARDDLDLAAAQELLRESQRRYAQIARPHTVIGMVTQGLYDQVRGLCERAGMPEAVGALVPGGQEEGRWLDELWHLAHGRPGTLDDFVACYGYHGPLEGELSSLSWRIDPSPLRHLLATYARDTDRERPADVFARRDAERNETEARLLAKLPHGRRVAAKALLAAARAYMPLRESGRATFLRAYDAARHAAWALGRFFAERGVLESETDVFGLTLDELTASEPPHDARDVVAVRRDLRRHYQTVTLPSLWTGDPTPLISVEDVVAAVGDEPLTGLGVSSGIAEGIVRVVLDPGDIGGIDDGDILVCRATDPSWASLFYVAGAVVADIGGDMSHGAVVARELGLPAVVNTRDGTRRLKTGEHVRVDGTTGQITRLAGAVS
jgi:pyruvate,water dikinase